MKDATSDGPYPAGERQGRSTFDKLAFLCFCLAALTSASIASVIAALACIRHADGYLPLLALAFIFLIESLFAASIAFFIYEEEL